MRERLASHYDRIWRAAVVLLATIGLAAAIVFIGLTTNLAAFLLGAVVAGATALQVGLARELPSADLLRSTPRLAVLGGLLVLAICGFAAAVGLETLVLVGLLQSSSTAEQRAAMADVRRAYLDELERRSPEAFAAWIGSGARAAGDPAKYFVRHTN